MKTETIIERRMNDIFTAQDALTKCWAPYLDEVNEHVKEEYGRELNQFERRNIAQCLENAIIESGLKSRSRLFEATTEDNISFLGVQLPVIAALVPSLVLNDIAVVQALDRRVGAAFYLDVKYGSNKGGVAAGQTMMSAISGHNVTVPGRRYAMAKVFDEVAQKGGSGLSGTVAYAPGVDVAGVVLKVDGEVAAVTNASGAFVGAGVSGTINAAGTYAVSIALNSNEVATLTYAYQYDLPEDAYGNKTGVPQADINITQAEIRAVDFPLRSRYSIGASIDLQKAHGINLEDELVKYLGAEVKFTIDQYGLDMVDEAAASGDAAAPIDMWNAQVGVGGDTWLWKKFEIEDRFEQGSNNIFEKTKRGIATFIVAGNNVARVIRQLPHFKAAAKVLRPTGPINIGTLNGRTVIQNPFKDKDVYTMGYRGDHFLQAGFIYCPYIPLFATPTLTTSDLMAQKGYLSAAGFKVINAGLFTTGKIKNLGKQD